MPDGAMGKQSIRHEPREALPASGQVRERATDIDATEDLSPLAFNSDSDSTSRATAPTIANIRHRSSKKQSPRRLSEVTSSRQRPQLTRKAATAPPRTHNVFCAKPQSPRRAISARAPHPKHSRESRSRQDSVMSPLMPHLSQLGTTTSRSLISRKKSGRKSVGSRLGLKRRHSVWRLQPPPTLTKYEMISESLENKRSPSSSEKESIKETLKNRKLENLNTNIVDFKQRKLPDTPTSMVNTPQELYGTRRELPKEGRSVSCPRRGTPRLGRRLKLEPNSANKQKYCPLPLTPVIQKNMALRSPKPDPWRRNVYLPGPIELSATTLTASHKASIATLEAFVGEIEATALSSSNSRRLSDDATMDGIVEYFQAFGIFDEATEDELDRYWEETQLDAVPTCFSAKALRTLGLDDVPNMAMQLPVLDLPSSTSPFHSTWRGFRQQEDKQQPIASPTNPRQLVRFRRLLNSATSIL